VKANNQPHTIPGTKCRQRRVVHILIFVLALLYGTAWAKTLYVEKWGSDGTGCAKSTPCGSVQHAIDQSKKNDRIKVGPGIYTENLEINVSAIDNQPLDGLKLESTAGRFATIIEAASGSSSVIEILRSNVRVGGRGKGFTFRGAVSRFGLETTGSASNLRIEGNRSSGNSIGMVLNGRATVVDNIITDNTGEAISCAGCERSVIKNNRISNHSTGINAFSSDRIRIERNVLSNNLLTAISIKSSTENAVVIYNVIERSGTTGLEVLEANGAVVKGNILVENGSTAAHEGMEIVQNLKTRKPAISHNLMVGNGGSGAVFSNLEQPKIERNIAVNNEVLGFAFSFSVVDPRIDRNSSYANNPGTAFSCGVLTPNSTTLTVKRHFFGGTDIGCGPINQTSPAAKPNTINVNAARAL